MRTEKKCTEPSFCRDCKQPVFWVVTHLGKRMPVDAKPVANGNLVLTHDKQQNLLKSETFDASQPTHRYVGDPHPAVRNRYVSHFGTCPDAAKFRKPKDAK